MSSMFNNFFGKGLKKFANIFSRTGVGSLDLNKDSGILNNLTNKSNSDSCSITEYDYNTIGNKENSNAKILPMSWNEEKKNKELVVNLPVNQFKRSINNIFFLHHFCFYYNNKREKMKKKGFSLLIKLRINI